MCTAATLGVKERAERTSALSPTGILAESRCVHGFNAGPEFHASILVCELAIHTMSSAECALPIGRPRISRSYLTDAWFDALDEEGRAACAAAKWWRAMRADSAWKVHYEMKHRYTYPRHFVMGRASPFYIEALASTVENRLAWVAYFGPYTTNSRTDLIGDTVQGGAISSIFDLMCAITAQRAAKMKIPTGTLTVRMRQPVPPLRALLVEAWLDDMGGRKVRVKARLTDPSAANPTALLAEAEAVHVVPRGRGEVAMAHVHSRM